MTEVITEVIEEKPKVIEIDLDFSLIEEIEKYGALDASACINCGNCTAICGLTGEDEGDFPRKIIRYMQLGQKKEVLSSTSPWMCYYCGECSATCPKGANPGEIMMAVRRYQTAKFDYTGQGKRYYTSHKASYIGILVWFLLPIAWLAALLYTPLGAAVAGLLGGPTPNIVTSEVRINEFAPVEIMNMTAHIYGIFLGSIMTVGLFRMWRAMLNKDVAPNVKLTDYVNSVKPLITVGITARRWLACGKEHKFHWLKHLILIVGYGGMFILVVGFLPFFQTEAVVEWYQAQRLLGYILTAAIIFSTVDIILARRKKDREMHKTPHHTDWVFPIAILTVAVTGIMVNIFRLSNWPVATYLIYAIHLGVTSIMLSTEVGVGKWAHIFYRPAAYFFDSVKKKALEREMAVSTGVE